MKKVCLIFVVIFLYGCIHDINAAGPVPTKDDNLRERYSCLFNDYRPPITCESEGGQCITGCPPTIRYYNINNCPCGTTCCVYV